MILDIICGAILVVLGLIGLFKGFAKQVFGIPSLIAGLIGAYALLIPVHNFCYDLFIAGIAESLAGILGGWTDLVVMILLYIVLTIACAIVWKILKFICFPFCDRPFWRFFDRILGLALGLCWGAIIAGALLFLVELIPTWSFIPANVGEMITSTMATMSEGSVVVKPIAWEYLEMAKKFILDIWASIAATFAA